MAESLPVIKLIILTIALSPISYMLTMFATKTDGPFGVFFKMRLYAGVYLESSFDGIGDEILEEKSNGDFFADVLSCHRCTTPYATAVAIAFFVVFGLVPFTINIVPLWAMTSGATLYLFEADHD